MNQHRSMKIDELNNKHLIADEGKVLRRISDKLVVGKEIFLGYTHYLNGERLSEPLMELPKHYEEVEEPQTDNTVLIDDDTFMVENADVVEEEVVALMKTVEEVESIQPKRKITVADYIELENKVNMLLQASGIKY